MSYFLQSVVATTGGTMTGPLLLPDGTVTTPGLAFASDADGTGTGFYRPSANQIATAINGSLTHLFVASRFLIRSNSADITFGTSDDVSLARRSAGTAVAPLGGSTFSAAANSVTLGGVANVNTTSQATTGTTEEVLATYTLPANALSANGKGVRITAWYTGSGAGNKQVHLRFGGIGGTLVATMPTSTTAAAYRATAVIIRTGAATQVAHGEAHVSAVAPTLTNSAPTQTLTNAVDIVATATTATLGQISFIGMIVEFFN